MIRSLDPTTLLFAAFVLIFLLLFMAMLMLFFVIRENQLSKNYDFQSHRAKLSGPRDYFERSIASATANMTSSEEGWRDANHLVISSVADNKMSDATIEQSRFLQDFGFSKSDFIIDQKLIFVLTPFADRDLDAFYEVARICQGLGFNAVRGDEEFKPGQILNHILQIMIRSRLVIANISSRNANVFYELGIAQALGKPTILISKNIDGTPFDVQSSRIVLYNNELELRLKLTETFARFLASEP